MEKFHSLFGIFETKSKYEKTKRLCAYYARQYGFGHLSDEFTSYALEKLVNGRKAEIKKLAVDYIRHEYKTNRTTKKPKTFSISSLSKQFESLQYNKPTTLQDFSDACDNLGIDNINHRIICFMLFYCGLERNELASFLGVSPERISQILQKIKQSITKDV